MKFPICLYREAMHLQWFPPTCYVINVRHVHIHVVRWRPLPDLLKIGVLAACLHCMALLCIQLDQCVVPLKQLKIKQWSRDGSAKKVHKQDMWDKLSHTSLHFFFRVAICGAWQEYKLTNNACDDQYWLSMDFSDMHTCRKRIEQRGGFGGGGGRPAQGVEPFPPPQKWFWVAPPTYIQRLI